VILSTIYQDFAKTHASPDTLRKLRADCGTLVILRSVGDEERCTFWVVCATVSSIDNMSPPKAIPPIAIFLRKLRRLSLVSGLAISALMASSSDFSLCLSFSAARFKILLIIFFLLIIKNLHFSTITYPGI